MKTSEVIRKAINNHLMHEQLNKVEYNNQMQQCKLPYLCWAIVFACFGNSTNIGAGLHNNVEALPKKLKEVVAIINKEVTLFSEYASVTSKSDYEELQQIRYMYADFLAYYFEDQGD